MNIMSFSILTGERDVFDDPESRVMGLDGEMEMRLIVRAII